SSLWRCPGRQRGRGTYHHACPPAIPWQACSWLRSYGSRRLPPPKIQTPASWHHQSTRSVHLCPCVCCPETPSGGGCQHVARHTASLRGSSARHYRLRNKASEIEAWTSCRMSSS